MQADIAASYSKHGFALINDSGIGDNDVAKLRAEANRLLNESRSRGGARQALVKSRLMRDFAASGPPANLAALILGQSAQPTALTVFDKAPGRNWKVPWHQDVTIAVAKRREVPGFGPWSVKEGQAHVQPPAEILAQVLAIRLHLDDTGEENGALRVVAGSHVFGRLNDDASDDLLHRMGETTCRLPAGGAMLMSPLLLHASSAASSPTRRRVLHFEYSSATLPAGLEWA